MVHNDDSKTNLRLPEDNNNSSPEPEITNHIFEQQDQILDIDDKNSNVDSVSDIYLPVNNDLIDDFDSIEGMYDFPISKKNISEKKLDAYSSNLKLQDLDSSQYELDDKFDLGSSIATNSLFYLPSVADVLNNPTGAPLNFIKVNTAVTSTTLMDLDMDYLTNSKETLSYCYDDLNPTSSK